MECNGRLNVSAGASACAATAGRPNVTPSATGFCPNGNIQLNKFAVKATGTADVCAGFSIITVCGVNTNVTGNTVGLHATNGGASSGLPPRPAISA